MGSFGRIKKPPVSEKSSCKSHVIELEVKLAEMLKPLEHVQLTDENAENLRASYFKVHKRIFEEIIEASPYARLLMRIKEVYENDPITINRLE
jgi:hypothetical protein